MNYHSALRHLLTTNEIPITMLDELDRSEDLGEMFVDDPDDESDDENEESDVEGDREENQKREHRILRSSAKKVRKLN